MSDNSGVVEIINKTKLRNHVRHYEACPTIGAGIFEIQYLISISPCSYQNVIADHLSRLHFGKARQVAPWTQLQPQSRIHCDKKYCWLRTGAHRSIISTNHTCIDHIGAVSTCCANNDRLSVQVRDFLHVSRTNIAGLITHLFLPIMLPQLFIHCFSYILLS